MQIDALAQLMAMHPEVDVLSQALSRKCNRHFLLSGLYASAQAIILTALRKQLANKGVAQPMIIVLDDSDAAQYMYADIKTLIDERDVYFLPCSHRRRQKTDEALTVQRTEVLTALLGNKAKGERREASPIILTTPEALAEAVPNPQVLEKNKISLAVG